eukprot:6490727-Amphidinium_carterae.4
MGNPTKQKQCSCQKPGPPRRTPHQSTPKTQSGRIGKRSPPGQAKWRANLALESYPPQGWNPIGQADKAPQDRQVEPRGDYDDNCIKNKTLFASLFRDCEETNLVLETLAEYPQPNISQSSKKMYSEHSVRLEVGVPMWFDVCKGP